MHPCRLLLPSLLAASLAIGVAHACPDSDAATSARVTGRVPAPSHPSSAQALLAWKPRAWQPPVRANALQPGMRVAIDPIDGTMSMPTDDEFAVDASVEIERAPLQTILHADGTVQVMLDDRFAEYAVASKTDGGRPIWTCVKGPTGVAQFTKRTAPMPAAPVAPVVKWEEK